ncbi:hypothetical protein TSAR_000645 [Trichomalopsis sarcophagae]|uniref:Reverse transcriptase domain-containing protein n=1 Tax=Trichomalopsis sarcophagae TaxID=543379 RepID=A0A232ES16_9HYME|nr:hypothetical protein TSAR_000645 [Trichomalopsis sarcophagae]
MHAIAEAAAPRKYAKNEGPEKAASSVPPRLIKRVPNANYGLAKISHWALDNGLVINATKTQAMWVSSRGFISRIILDDTVITPCSSLKILGVVIDSTLSWREQCNIMARKCFAALSRLRKCRSYLTKDTRFLLIKTLIFPYLDYWASAFLDLLKKLILQLVTW